MPQRHLPLGVILEPAPNAEIGEIIRDRSVEVEEPVLDGHQDAERREALGHRLDAEQGLGRDRFVHDPARVAVDPAPENGFVVDDGDGHSRRILFA